MLSCNYASLRSIAYVVSSSAIVHARIYTALHTPRPPFIL